MNFSRLLFFLLLGSALKAADLYTVKFIVRSPFLPARSNVFITGNQNELGNWAPSGMLLNPENGAWTATLTFPGDVYLEYKFTLGSWEQEAQDRDGHIFPNFRLTVRGDTVLVYTIEKWGPRSNQTASEHIVGQIRYHHHISTPGLQPRDLVVWLPSGYHINRSERYPVLYMHDGQNLFSAHTAGFGAEWRLDEIADSLITAGLIRPLIIVGIFNTGDRNLEYANGNIGRRYRDFVVHKIKPFIDKKYRTLPDQKYTVTGGSSMGGLVAFILLWENPEIFSGAICMSPAIFTGSQAAGRVTNIDNLDYVDIVKNSSAPPPGITIYLDNRGIGLENELQPGIDALLSALAEKGYRRDQDYFWIKDPDAPHHETAWSRRMSSPLQLFFKP